jgi:hypothetical protein
MTPTSKLRFVERGIPAPEYGDGWHKTGHTLQQWWEDRNIVLAVHVEDKDGSPLPPPMRGEWRDVPVEKEA